MERGFEPEAGEQNVTLDSACVPQADDLDKVRAVVDAVAAGARDSAEIASRTGFSTRHVEYRVRAAALLGLVRQGSVGMEVSPAGAALLRTRITSERERLLLLRAIDDSATLKSLAPDLNDEPPPSLEVLAERIEVATGLARSTAQRRASTLLTWRRRLRSPQLSLFDDDVLGASVVSSALR